MSEDHHDKPHAPDHPMTEFEWRVDAVQALLIEKGILTGDEVRRQVEEMDHRSPALGANVIARAWVDPAFKSHLLANAKSAILELGIHFQQEATPLPPPPARFFFSLNCPFTFRRVWRGPPRHSNSVIGWSGAWGFS